MLIRRRWSNQLSFANAMCPESGRVSPARQSSSVVLPAPEAPKRMVTPGESAKSTSSVKSRPAPLRRFLIWGSDHDLIRPRRNSGAGINAGAAAWLNHMRAGVLENIDIALAYTVIARFLRSKLDIELHRVRDAFALTQGVGQHAGIHVHIFILS